MHPLLSDTKTVDEALGFVVALALHDFSLSGLFELSAESDYAFVDRRLQNLVSKLGTIKHAGAVKVLFTSIQTLPKEKDKEGEDDAGFGEQQASLRRYYVYKLLERLSAHNHRNFAILNSLDFVGPLFDAYHTSTSSSTPTPRSTRPPSPTTPQLLQPSSSTQSQLHPHSQPPSRSASLPPSSSSQSLRVLPKPERQVILKLLKRLLELGSTSEEARQMFQAALNVKGEDTLNGDVLEVLRAGMKTRWPEHFSFVGPGALVVPCEPSKGLPSTGFTFMVSSDTCFCRKSN